jgi:Protein phosphatase inhibitor 2 (IPP-2)
MIMSRREGVKWDEENLQMNELIKAELNPTRIDEPKTPYHGPGSEPDGDDEYEEEQPFRDTHGLREGALAVWLRHAWDNSTGDLTRSMSP